MARSAGDIIDILRLNRTSCLGPSFRLGRSATGLGLFATKPIKRGCLYRNLSRPAHFGPKKPSGGSDRGAKYMFELNSKNGLSTARRDGMWRGTSTTPAGLMPSRSRGTAGFVFVALRAIAPGEEITYNYGKEYFDYFIRRRVAAAAPTAAARGPPNAASSAEPRGSETKACDAGRPAMIVCPASTARSDCRSVSPPQDRRRNVANDCPEPQPSPADLDRDRAAAHPWDGNSPELRAVPDARHARSSGDRGRLHLCPGGPEHRLGPVAGGGRRDLRSLRPAQDHDGGGGDLCPWPRPDGGGAGSG